MLAPFLIAKEKRPIKRAVDGGDSAAFSGIFLALAFSCSRSESQPVPSPLTHTVRRLNAKFREIQKIET